jgi:hypothetical protein
MGLLDEAIREHLELKRRHGGDASEIARLENEVLGPEQTAPPLTPPASAGAPVPADVPVVAHEPEPPRIEHEEPAVPAPAYEPLVAHEPEPEPDPVPEPAPEDAGQATVAFSIEEIEEAEQRPRAPAEPLPEIGEPEPGEHDELEETPEFLQETPEHDRMWFEQKPPKDFDF